ncbi:hypothetical protein SPHV1_2390003 [Novosphingobium sp. KN65.2]|nr:hypothetical protein SPHV1_2390003 [Novosphingobium sp. KN65.2]
MKCRLASMTRAICRGACKPGSVPGVVSQDWDLTPRRQPFLSATHCRAAPATNPGCLGPKPTRLSARKPKASSPYSVLLRVGFTMPLAVTGSAVRFYRTLSPLPASRRGIGGLLSVALSLSFPSPARESPGGRYPPPLFRGARTFLGLCPAHAELDEGRGCPAPRRAVT